MVSRLRTGWLAGGAALLLVLAFSGAVFGATVSSDTSATSEDVPFVDVDGDGVADSCDDVALENTDAAQAAFEAADLDDDGEISVSEAAQSGWTGGANCNHGGYVSQVAQAADDCEAEETEETGTEETGTEETGTEETGTEETGTEETEDSAACETEDAETGEVETADEETCEVVEAPELDPSIDVDANNFHGLWVSWVAASEAVGGKNCNHGGAVSEAAKKDQEVAKAARDAAKAEREAARAERKAARDAAKAERAAQRAAKGHGKPN